MVDKWSVYDWTRTYLLCVPEASVYSSVSDQQQRDLGNHTEEWSAREQRFNFIHPLGHRTRTLKAWKKKFIFICICANMVIPNISVARAVTYSRSACKTYLVKGHYIYIFFILCDTQRYSKPELILFHWRGASFFAFASHLVQQWSTFDLLLVMYIQSGVNTRSSFNCGFIYSCFS